jgi:hypothetical protein
LLLAVWMVAGCERSMPSPTESPAVPAEHRVCRFESRTAATVHGVVRWCGDLPEAAPFEIYPNALGGEVLSHRQTRANPNLPVVNAGNRGVGNAVVFLRGVDCDRARPWDLPPVRIEQRGCEFHVLQGRSDSQVGFVHRGDQVEMVSRDGFFHSLHADGPAFFTYTFPDPDAPLRRSLDREGLVELTSAAGYYWMRAFLFVAEHPYYARTDAGGCFELTQVPPGHYELVWWLPNWIKDRHERDPESTFVTRWFFRPPVEIGQQIELSAAERREADFEVSDRYFSRQKETTAGVPHR